MIQPTKTLFDTQLERRKAGYSMSKWDDFIINCFNENRISVVETLETKVKKSTCKKCKKLCFDSCIEWSTCYQWLYYSSKGQMSVNLTTNWLCEEC